MLAEGKQSDIATTTKTAATIDIRIAHHSVGDHDRACFFIPTNTLEQSRQLENISPKDCYAYHGLFFHHQDGLPESVAGMDL